MMYTMERHAGGIKRWRVTHVYITARGRDEDEPPLFVETGSHMCLHQWSDTWQSSGEGSMRVPRHNRGSHRKKYGYCLVYAQTSWLFVLSYCKTNPTPPPEEPSGGGSHSESECLLPAPGRIVFEFLCPSPQQPLCIAYSRRQKSRHGTDIWASSCWA